MNHRIHTIVQVASLRWQSTRYWGKAFHQWAYNGTRSNNYLDDYKYQQRSYLYTEHERDLCKRLEFKYSIGEDLTDVRQAEKQAIALLTRYKRRFGIN